MPQDNVEILRRMYQAFNRGDVGSALEVIDPEIEWRITPAAGPSPGTYHGHSGVKHAISSLLEVWAEYQNEPLEFVPVGDSVVARIWSRGHGRSSGIDIEGEVAHLWTLRDGKVVCFEAYMSTEQAVAAAQARALEDQD